MTTNIQSDTFLRVIYQYLYWQLPFHLLMKTLLGEKRHICEVVPSKLLCKKFWLYIILPFLISMNFSVDFLLKVYHNSITLEKNYIYNHLSLRRKMVFTRACSMPFITTVPSIVWKEDLDNIERVQSRKSAILFCLTSGRTINLSQKTRTKTKHCSYYLHNCQIN